MPPCDLESVQPLRLDTALLRLNGKTGICMPTKSANQMTSAVLLRQVLLDYLLASRVVSWPGGDGLTEDDILNCYPQAGAAGAVPDRQELCLRHAELVAEIQSLFTLKAWLGNDDSQ